MRVLSVLGWLASAHVAASAWRAWRGGAGASLVPAPRPQDAGGTMPRLPGVSVIVPAWNDSGTLESTFQALAGALASYHGEVQLLVVAGGPDNSYARARELLALLEAPDLSAEVLLQAPHGKNAALNEGLRAARHGVLVFLDADTAVDPDWLTALVLPIARGQADATTGMFRPYTRTPVSAIFEVDQWAAQRLTRRVTLFGGGTIALTRAALDRLGGELPEDVPVGVDWDLSQRLEKGGAVIAFCEGARVRTEIAQTWPEYWRGEVRWRRAYLWAQTRHLRLDRRPARLLGLLYVPLMQATVLVGWAILPGMAGLLGYPAHLGALGWGVLVGWTLGRHACTCLRVYASTRDVRWLRLIPAYLYGFTVSAAAAWAAILSFGQASVHFKGQRLRRSPA